MATKTLLTSNTSTADVPAYGTYVTPVIAPSANNLVLAWIGQHDSVNMPAAPTLSGCGLTWVQVDTVGYETRRLTLFRAMGASPSSGAVTITNANNWTNNCNWTIVEFGQVDTGGSNGADAVVQAVPASGTSLSPLATLAAFSDANNATAGGVYVRNTTTITKGSGFDEIAQNNSGENTQLQAQWRTDNDTSVDWSLGTSRAWQAIAVEIKAGSTLTAGGDPTLAAAPTNDRVSLAFTPSPNALATYVHRGSPGFTPAPGTRHTGNIGALADGHVDEDSVGSDTPYGYVIEWADAFNSVYSAELEADTAADPPTAYSFTPSTTSIQFTITRAANATDWLHRTFIEDSLGVLVDVVDFLVGGVTATVSGLTEGEQYTFRTQARDPSANGGVGAASELYTDTSTTTSSSRRAVVSWAEMAVPDASRRAVVSWAEMQFLQAFTRYNGVDATDRMVAGELVNIDASLNKIQRGTQTGGAVTFSPSFSAAPIVVAVPEVT